MLGIGIGVPFNVQSLIARVQAIFVGKTGYWGRPILLSSLFQDSAGTTPVTAVEQPVGLMLDQSGSGNHVTQATAAARPVVSSRVNLAQKTEALTDAYYVRTGLDVTGPFAAPNGNLIATNFIPTTTSSQKRVAFSALFPGLDITSFEVKSNGIQFVSIWWGSVHSAGFVNFDIINGTATLQTGATGTITPVAGEPGWYTITASVSGAVVTADTVISAVPSGSSVRSATMTGNGVDGFLVARPAINVGTSRTYQRVNTATDYDTAGFPSYLKFDGVDDSLSSATGGGGTAGFFFCAAVDLAATAGVRSLYCDRATNTGYEARIADGLIQLVAGNGTAFTVLAGGAVAGSTKRLVTFFDDGSNLSVQINLNTPTTVARPVVAAGSTFFTIGKDSVAGANYLNGKLYSPVYVRNSGLTAAERLSIQGQVAAEAGITL